MKIRLPRASLVQYRGQLRNQKFQPPLPQTPKPIHILKAYDNSYSKMKKEQKCKDEDDYKDYDKEKDAKRIIETLGVCYILGILMTQAFQV